MGFPTFLSILRRPVIIASSLGVVLGIAGLAGSRNEGFTLGLTGQAGFEVKIRRGGWEVDVVCVCQVGY